MITLRYLLNDALPYFAPLSRPIVAHLFSHYYQQQTGKKIDLQDPDTPLDGTLVQAFIIRHRQSAYVTYRYMVPFLLDGEYSSEWLSEAISRHSPSRRPVPSQTFSSWRARGLLKDLSVGFPRLEYAAALLSARMDEKKRLAGWLPSSVDNNEPHHWCWRQDTPLSPILPCPVPIPENIPDHAFLWTEWAGESLALRHPKKVVKSDWCQLSGSIGAARFAGTTHEPYFEQVQWKISLKRLQEWDSDAVRAMINGIPFPEQKELLCQSIAEVVIRRLGLKKIEEIHQRMGQFSRC